MDTSITLITPEYMRASGARAFDEGLGVDDHNMNWHAPARKDWQYGWHARRVECSRQAGNVAHQLAEISPP